MSSGNVVDSKVVELGLENRNFETNAKTSLSTLERLKAALKFANAADSFNDIDASVKKINMNGLTNGVNSFKSALNQLKSVAVFSLMFNEVTKLQNAFEGLVKSLTIDQASAGWSKYADKTQAVQTIMAATAKDFNDQGEQMEYVNSQLEKLNWFTDETSYNFLDMVNNIGKFTSNNIKLDQAVTSMEGISTWAAISGANVNEAGRAMYNLSQAISVGSVKLMDWKSIENANMATFEFKQTAIETAEALKLLKKTGDDSWETMAGHAVSATNFNQALSDGWFTSEVLLTTLEKYGKFTDELYGVMEQVGDSVTTSQILEYVAKFKEGTLDIGEAAAETGVSASTLKGLLSGLSAETLELGEKAFKAAQEAKTFQEAIDATKDAVSTGWMNTFEIMFGDYLHAKNLWTDLANDLYTIFAEGGNSRNELLKEAFNHGKEITESDWNQITEAGIASPSFIKAVREAAGEYGDSVDEIGDNNSWLNAVLHEQRLTIDDVRAAYEKTFGGGSNVDQGIKDQVEAAKTSDEAFSALLSTLEQYSAEDIEKVAFGDGKYAEGAEELEGSLDAVIKSLGLTQDQGGALVDVLKSMGYFGGLTAESFKGMSDEQLKEKGWTEENIKAFRDAEAAGQDLDAVMDEISSRHVTPGETWFSALSSAMEGVVDLVGVMREEWANVFPPTTSSQIIDFINSFASGVEKARNFIETSEELRAVIRGVFSALDLVVGVIRTVVSGAFTVFDTILDSLGIDLWEVAANVGNAITAFDKWIKENEVFSKAIQLVSDSVAIVIKLIQGLVDNFMSLPIVQRNIDRFKEAFSATFKEWMPYLKGGAERISKFIEYLKGLDKIDIHNLPEIFQKLKEDVIDYFIKEFPGFGKITEAFSALADDIGHALSVIGDAITERFNKWREDMHGTLVGNVLDAIANIVDAIKGIFKKADGVADDSESGGGSIFDRIANSFNTFFLFMQNIPWGKIAAFAAGFLGIKAAIKIVSTVLGLGVGIFKGARNLIKNLGDVFGSLSGVLDEQKKALKANIFKTYAISIGILVASLYVLSQIDTEKLWICVGVLAVLSAMLVGVAVLMDKLGTLKGISFSSMASLLAIAAAVTILAATLKILSGIDSDHIVRDLAILTAMMIGMVGVAYALSSLSGPMASGGASLIMFALSLKVLVDVIEKIDNLDIKNPVKTMGILLILMGSLAAVAVAANGIKFSGGVGFLLIAAAIKLLVGAVMDIAEVEDSGRLIAAVAVIGSLGLILVAIGALTGKMKGVNLKKMASLALIAASVYILARSVKMLADIDPSSLSNAELAIEMLALCLTAMTFALSKIKTRGIKAGALIGISASILILAAAAKMLAELDSRGLTNAEFAIAILSGCLVAVARLLSSTKLSVKTSFSTVLMMAAIAGLAAIAKSLAKLGTYDLIKGEAAVAALGGILAAISVVASKAKMTTRHIFGFLAISASIAILSQVVKDLSTLDPDGLGQALIAIGALALCIGGIMTLSHFTSVSATDIGAIATIAGTVSTLATALSILAKNDPEQIMAAAKSLAMLMGMFSVLTLVSRFARVSGRSMIALIGVVGGIGLVLGLLTKFTDADKAAVVADSLSKLMLALSVTMGVMTLIGMAGPAALIGVGSALALVAGLGILIGVLGDFVGQGIEDFTSHLSAVAEDLNLFANGIMPFMTTIRGINAGDFEGLRALAASLIDIGKGELLSALSSLFNGGKSSVESFSEQLPLLGKGLSAYADSLGDNISMDKVNASAAAIQLLATIVKNDIPNSGGVLGWITGNKDKISNFATQLPELANGLAAYADAINATTFNEDKINASTSLASMLATLTKNEIPDGGVIGWLHGNKEKISQFGVQLPVLATGLASYSDQINETAFDDAKIEASSNLVSMLASLAGGELPDGGVIGFLHGNKTIISDFATQLPPLASALSDYANTIDAGAFDSSKIEASSNLVQILATLAGETIPEGGLVGWLQGNDTVINEFSAQLPTLAKNLSTYVATIDAGMFDSDKIEASSNLVQLLATMAGEQIGDGGLIGFIRGNGTKISEFGLQLPSLARSLASYARIIGAASFDTDKINASSNLVEILGTLSGDTIDDGGVIGFFTGNAVKVSDFADQLPALATAIGAYSTAIGEATFDSDKITASSDLVSMLATLTKESIESGGVIGFLKGNGDKITDFSAQLPALATGLAGYADTISAGSFDDTKIEASKNLASMLASLTDESIPEGGVMGWLKGNDSFIETFANQLPTLATGIAGYSDNISSVSPASIVKSTLAIRSITEIVEAVSSFKGDYSISGFGDALIVLGDDIATFLGDFDPDALTNVGNAIATFALVATTNMNLGTAFESLSAISLSTGDISDATVVAAFVANVDSLKTSISGVAELNTAGIKKLTEAVNGLNNIDLSGAANKGAESAISNAGSSVDTSKFADSAKAAMTAMTSAFSDASAISSSLQTMISTAVSSVDATQFTTKGTELITALAEGIGSYTTLSDDVQTPISTAQAGIDTTGFKNAGQTVGANFSHGVNSSVSLVTMAIKSMNKKALGAVDTSGFSKSGRHVVEGFANGITANTFKAKASAKAMARAALDSANAELRVSSPSKEFYKTGNFSVLGFSNALYDGIGTVYRASSTLADSALEGVNRGVSAIRSMLDVDLNVDPVVRPVLDLSEIENGAYDIQNMLNLSTPIPVTGNLNAINTNMQTSRNAVTNDDILAALTALRPSDIDRSGSGDVYNVNGVTYDDGTNVTDAVRTLIRAANVKRRRA